MNRIFIAAAAVASFGLAAGANAATTSVQTSDLNLASAEGQAKLQTRLDRAARKVCSDTVTSSRIRAIDSECVARARAAVEKQLAAQRSTSSNGG
jgi:UrcA family protein